MEFKTHKSLSDTTRKLLETSTIRVVCKLGKIMEERGINQTELSLLTGIRQPSINDIIHNKKVTINTQHLLAIMLVLKLTDISDMYEVVINPAEKEKLDEERQEAEMLGILQEQHEILQQRKKKD